MCHDGRWKRLVTVQSSFQSAVDVSQHSLAPGEIADHNSSSSRFSHLTAVLGVASCRAHMHSARMHHGCLAVVHLGVAAVVREGCCCIRFLFSFLLESDNACHQGRCEIVLGLSDCLHLCCALRYGCLWLVLLLFGQMPQNNVVIMAY